MKLELYYVRPSNLLDTDTMTDYYTNNGLNVARNNRGVYEGSEGFKEIELAKLLFAFHTFYESGKEFATLTPYRLNPSPCSKRTYKFGCFNINTQNIYFFFKGKNLGKHSSNEEELESMSSVLGGGELHSTMGSALASYPAAPVLIIRIAEIY